MASVKALGSAKGLVICIDSAELPLTMPSLVCKSVGLEAPLKVARSIKQSSKTCVQLSHAPLTPDVAYESTQTQERPNVCNFLNFKQLDM